MNNLTSQSLFIPEMLLFASVVFLHFAKKSVELIFLYAAQSLLIVVALLFASLKETSSLLIAVTVLTFLVKVILVPYLSLRLTRRYKMHFSIKTYLNVPITMIVLALLTAFAYSGLFKPLTILIDGNANALLLAIGMIFISIFLIVNRKGVLSQIFGVLSLENAIISFAHLAGLETMPGLQLGILFDILVWILIAIVFSSMIYLHFGSQDTSAMQHLKEE
jgi:hydrogenase-4 component E